MSSTACDLSFYDDSYALCAEHAVAQPNESFTYSLTEVADSVATRSDESEEARELFAIAETTSVDKSKGLFLTEWADDYSEHQAFSECLDYAIEMWRDTSSRTDLDDLSSYDQIFDAVTSGNEPWNIVATCRYDNCPYGHDHQSVVHIDWDKMEALGDLVAKLLTEGAAA
jgi:hypothetical protein